MLVDPDTGAPRPLSGRVLAEHGRRASPGDDDDAQFGADAGLEQELFLHQLETGTVPCHAAEELHAELVSCRRTAVTSAAAAGATLVAVGTPVLAGDEQQVTPQPRYQRIVQEFGRVGRQGSVCGTHVHVEIADDDEGVRVIDGLRPWLPVLRAISVNSPFWHGDDTGYASWRSQVWGRWPTAGPSDRFETAAGYSAVVDALISSGAALDRGMLYFDARLSEHYSTVEVRVFDAMTEPDDIVLVAVLTRALVTALAADDPHTADVVLPWRADLLRAAHWRASRYGLSAQLLDPESGGPLPARRVVERLIERVGPFFADDGERERAARLFEALLARGTGAVRQRAAAKEGGGAVAVAADLQERFAATLR